MITQIMDAIPALARAIKLAQAFATMVRHRDTSAFAQWITAMRDCGLPPFRRLALSFQQDA